MLLEMDKLERKHYLKHYLGGFAMVSNGHAVVTGQLEDIQMEDGSVLMKSGERSQWVDGEDVTPSVKTLKDMYSDFNDLKILIDNIIIDGKSLCSNNVNFTKVSYNGEIHRLFIPYDKDENSNILIVTGDWKIYTVHRELPDNIGTIIFLLCELGYDVTGIFKK
jgi:hypothetical protein